ncbi:alanine--tRNA ligase [Mucisphaera sp.]|uniref:alanine--tRNA ligase n=1 Tax=Mucisphaera sp. TaxID=2913024 RepID=UPI003D146EA7
MPTSTEIRQQFVDFFVKKHSHTNIPSSPVVPHDDPTLLFANAGMNQFKPYFLGTETPHTRRVANTQKCIRAGGKHNDLDDVGKDTYHHTFFEMLGNWSFGDYFKAEAIDWAWQLLTEVWGLDPARLHATYFEGDPAEGLEPDTEAQQLWQRYLPPERVHPGNKKDNFWEMGDVGPCGPCSELHYDGTPDLSGASKVNADDPNVIEIWNLVFIQFNRSASGSLEPLPDKHVDTGMGFERIVRVLQGKDSNYDTDVFTPIFEAIQKITGAPAYQQGGHDEQLRNPINIAYRVIADHARCLTFALADAAHCGNKGRDAVLRTILRRAVRFGHQTLNVEEPFLYKLVPAVVEHMGKAFPEITRNPKAIEDELREEEIAFRKTLERGIHIFDRATEGLKAGNTLPGDTAFDLEATYGFPISLTQVMAEERGLTVDLDGYEQAKARHADISRGEAAAGGLKQQLVELVQKHDLPDTEFIGHNAMSTPPTEQQAHLFLETNGELAPTESATVGDTVAVVIDMTPFYAEAGGQVGDTGQLALADAQIGIHDTQRIGSVYFHLGQVTAGTAKAGQTSVAATIDESRRRKIMSNHTTTHVLNRALRDLVNPDAMQRGSLVDEDKLRFDFAHNAPVTIDEITAVEKQVNDDIAADLPVYAEVADQQDALKINGLRAVFGEKYPPKVRVVSIGQQVHELLTDPDNDNWAKLSIEFCGGTHLAQTGEAQGFVITSEENVAKGIRRITGLTGDAGHRAQSTGEMLRHRAESLAGLPADKLATALPDLTKELDHAVAPLAIKQQIREQLAKLQDTLKQAQKDQQKQAASAIADVARDLADAATDGQPIIARIDGADANALRTAMDVIRKKCPASPMMLIAVADPKVALLAAVPKDLIAQGLKAGDWVKAVAPVVGGGGGGRPDMAQAGGKDPSKVNDALEAARQFVAEKVSA